VASCNKYQGFFAWDYWNAHVQQTIAFFKRVLKLGQEDMAEGEQE